jgi:GH43 family beta-xylosidase
MLDAVSGYARSFALLVAALAGCVPRTATVAPATFSNPIVRSQAAGDPWVVRYGNAYYFTATLTPDKGLWVWKSRTLTGLDSGVKLKVWDAPRSGPLSRQIWAPELHRLRGRWYLYFTASDGVDANHRHYVLVATTDDPQGPYDAPVRVDPAFERYAIDGSILEMPNGRLYFMYCAGGVFIAPMSDPLHVSGPGVQIIRGSEEWEHEWRYLNGRWEQGAGYWVEAPEALIHDGRVFVVYSAGHTATPHYYLGLLTLTGSDPLDSASWTKRREPLFAPYEGADGNVFTPGHNSFTKSPDGREDWLVYHARDVPYEDGSPAGRRTVRAQRFSWAPDGSPELGHPVPSGIQLRKPSGEDSSPANR